ncbi:GH25 family lysozyme [Neobacillus niacini]|uniref:GH25 family lysozyme n=1 Tax=Neobacillus niacini TaxID=86668 RepID=UPI00300041F4
MKARTDTDLYGADISSYQSITNPVQFFTDFSFVYFRAYGSDHSSGGDTKFNEFVQLAKQYNVPSGGYFFATPAKGVTDSAGMKADAEAQAQMFIDKLQEAYGAGRFGDLVPMLDVEAYQDYLDVPILPEDELKLNAFYLTSLMETSTYRNEYPAMFGIVGGNFDGAGTSYSAIQYNWKSGTLQQIVVPLVDNYPDVVQSVFDDPADYNEFVDVVKNRTKDQQVAWGDSITDWENDPSGHTIKEPWATYLRNLGLTQASIDLTIGNAQQYHTQARKQFDEFGLYSRRGYALMFDISVQSWAIPASAKTLIWEDFGNISTSLTKEEQETEKLKSIANRTADTIDISWRESYRARKLAVATGYGVVYGSLVVDTNDPQYNMTLDPAFETSTGTEKTWGFPYVWGMTGAQLREWILYFRNYFRTTTGGRAVGLYTNRYFLTETAQMGMTAADLQELAIMPLWLAEWNQTDGYAPATLGGWANYAVWQYGMITDADAHGVSHAQNQIDHNVTQNLSLIMPPKPPTQIKLQQLDNTTIRVTFTPPDDSDYIGSDVYLNGVYANKWLPKPGNTVDIPVTTPIGSQLQINVVSQDNYQDTSWSQNTYLTMVDMSIVEPVKEPDQVINYVGRVSGDESRKIMVNALDGIELEPSWFGAEWWDYPAMMGDDGTYMSYTANDADGDKVQFLFQFEVDKQEPTPIEELNFRIKGIAGQPFTLKFWNHTTGAWDEGTTVEFVGAANEYINISTTDMVNHVGADNRVYISMLSTNSVINPPTVLTSKTYTIDWMTAIRQTTGEIVATATPLYTGGSTGIASYIGIGSVRQALLNDKANSRVTPNFYLHLNGTVAGFGRLGFHDLTTQPTVAGAVPTIHTTATTRDIIVGWQSWDISLAMNDNLSLYQGPVVYANASEASAQAYGNTNDANEIYIEVKGDWQTKTTVTLGADYAELQIFRAIPTPPAPEPVELPPDVLTYDYTKEDVMNMLYGRTGSRFVKFRFDLLDRNENKIGELLNVESSDISMNAFNTIKRTANFRIRETEAEQIDYLNNRIQPFAEFKLPDKFVQNADGSRVLLEGAWVEFPLGVFLLSSPKKVEQNYEVFRDIEAYDGGVILDEDKFTERYTVTAGTKYTDAVKSILVSAGITKYNIAESDKTLPNDMEYEPGTSKSEPIADFLNAINFTQLYVDEYGYFSAQAYVSPSDREPNHFYLENEFSVIVNGVEEELDLYSVPNKWVAVYTSADSTSDNVLSLTSTYTNENPESVTSTASRGRTIVDYRKVNEIADQAALDQFVQRIAFEASQIFGKVRFQTALMPIHGFQDVIHLQNSRLGIDGKYSETSWKMPLKPGALMEHECRRVVTI